MDKIFDKLPYDNLENIKFAHLLAGAAGISLVIIVAYYFTLFSATNVEFEKLVKKRETAERTLKSHKAIVAKGDLAAKDLARVSGQLEAYKKQMPVVDELPGLLQQVSGFGKNRNMEMVAFELTEGSVKDFYKEIPFEIKLRGDLWGTLDFFEYMQNLLRVLNFEDLNLESQQIPIMGPNGPTGKSAYRLNTKMTAKTYSFVEGSDNRPVAGEKPPAK